MQGDEAPSGPRCVHGCIHHKHLLACLEEAGAERVKRKEEVPSARAALCLVHAGAAGCPCRSPWRIAPRALTGLLGGKYSLARLLASEGADSVAPETYVTVRGWESRKPDCGAVPCKWFVKISHQCSRRGMLCSADPAEIAAYASSLPKHVRYVIQREAASPLLLGGRKVILRLWALLTVSGAAPGSAQLHFSRRLRVNRLGAPYSADAVGRDADLAHESCNAFPDSAQWDLYPHLWEECRAVSEKVLRVALRRWVADLRRHPAPGEGPQPGTAPPPSGGWLNIFAFDFVPSCSASASLPRPVLLEVNVDPGFQNKCAETRAAAEDITEFCLRPVTWGDSVLLPDSQFQSVRVPLPLPAAAAANRHDSPGGGDARGAAKLSP
eukprot:TRINITY_DN66470_c0_g1_i1.p1 TRINITY_DN66470_c0_g1~~TRINITY_DN66470_c0_g1_i1.p1  ORF type:complete len:404 (+),score=102.19 TRINITY_DN66470_c0_g1_i1:69-1214(+)